MRKLGELGKDGKSKFFSLLFRIIQHRDIYIFNFKTQLAIIRVFWFINCFPFLYSQWIDKISSNVNQRTYKKCIYYFYSLLYLLNIKFIPNTTISTFVFLKFYCIPVHGTFNKSSDPIYRTGSGYLVHSISLA